MHVSPALNLSGTQPLGWRSSFASLAAAGAQTALQPDDLYRAFSGRDQVVCMESYMTETKLRRDVDTCLSRR